MDSQQIDPAIERRELFRLLIAGALFVSSSLLGFLVHLRYAPPPFIQYVALALCAYYTGAVSRFDDAEKSWEWRLVPWILMVFVLSVSNIPAIATIVIIVIASFIGIGVTMLRPCRARRSSHDEHSVEP